MRGLGDGRGKVAKVRSKVATRLPCTSVKGAKLYMLRWSTVGA
jgi:hypothetical protein